MARWWWKTAAAATAIAVAAVVPTTSASAATAPATPAAPTVTAATASSATVSVVLPGDGGSPFTSGRVRAYAATAPATVAAQLVVDLTGSTSGQSVPFTITGLTAGTRYAFTATVTNAVGTSTASPASADAVPPFRSVGALVDQQFVDFTSRAPTAAERADLVARIQAGTTTAADAVGEVSAKPEWATLDPLTRIYYAYFLRAPDSSGLAYWLGRRRAGVRVVTISNQFARSSEFVRRYGNISERGFVQLIYQNVLGRAGDPAGVNSWTNKLETGVKTRGEVMVQFSESSEHQRRRAGEVNTVSVVFGMLRRAPRAGELSSFAPVVKATKQPLVGYVLGLSEYDDRIAT